MNREEVRKLAEWINQCSCVSKGEGDDKETYMKFKIVCGENFNVLNYELDKWNILAQEKSEEMIPATMSEFELKASKIKSDKAMKKLEKQYAKELEAYGEFEKWYENEFVKGEVELPELQKWPFIDLPENISGGFIPTLKPMISGYPE